MWKERSERSDVWRGLNPHCCLEDGGRGRWPRNKVVSGGDDDPQLTAPKERRSPCYCCMDLNPATTRMSLEQDALQEPPGRNAALWDSEQRSQPSPLDLWPLSVWPFITQQQETTAEVLAGRGHNALLGMTDVVQLQTAAVVTHVCALDQSPNSMDLGIHSTVYKGCHNFF